MSFKGILILFLVLATDDPVWFTRAAAVPIAIGWAAGNGLAGPLYDTVALRNVLARQYFVPQLGMPPEATKMLTDRDLVPTFAAKPGNGATPHEAIGLLWSAYQPWIIWLRLGAVGLASLAAMVILHRRGPANS